MEAFTVRDLCERSGELVRVAEQGQLAVVTKTRYLWRCPSTPCCARTACAPVWQ